MMDRSKGFQKVDFGAGSKGITRTLVAATMLLFILAALAQDVARAAEPGFFIDRRSQPAVVIPWYTANHTGGAGAKPSDPLGNASIHPAVTFQGNVAVTIEFTDRDGTTKYHVP